MSTLVVHRFEIGPLDNYVYILADSKSKECVFIDPAWDPKLLISCVREHDYTPVAIWITHGHHDHVNGITEVLQTFPLPVWISRNEAPSLIPTDIPNLQFIDDLTEFKIGTYTVTCLFTPGHTPGGLCLQVESLLFTGDTLFVDGCGRCNFDNSNVDHMYDSLQRIMALPDHLEIYPGHSYADKKTDTLYNQKHSNRFLLCSSRAEFVRKRMGFRA